MSTFIPHPNEYNDTFARDEHILILVDGDAVLGEDWYDAVVGSCPAAHQGGGEVLESACRCYINRQLLEWELCGMDTHAWAAIGNTNFPCGLARDWEAVLLTACLADAVSIRT